MDKGGNRTWNLLWLVLIGTVTAAIPVVVYLTLTRERPRPEPTRPPGASVNADLERLGDHEPLYRDSVIATLGDRTVIEAVDLRKNPGEDGATARVMQIHIEPFFSARKEALDNTWTEVFAALPPGASSVISEKTTIRIGLAHGRELALPEMRVRLASEEGSVRITGDWDVGDSACSVELVYTLHRGLLFLRFDCPGSHFPASFLPPGEELWFDTLAITSGSYLELTNPRVEVAETGATQFAAKRLVFSARSAVSRSLIGSGLAADKLREERNWKLELFQVSTSLGKLGGIPPFASFGQFPAVDFAADEVTMESGGTISFASPKAVWEQVGTFTAKAVDLVAAGKTTRFAFKEPRLEEAQWGLALVAPEATLERSAQKVFRLEVEPYSVELPGNPLRLAALLKEAGVLRERLKGIRKENLELPKLALPTGLPDCDVRFGQGTVALPFGGGAKITDATLAAKVRGGMIETLTAGLCVGGAECRELGVGVSLRTDSLGQPEKVTFRGRGARAAKLVKEHAPDFVQGLGDIDADCTLSAAGRIGTYKSECVLTLTDLTVFHKRLAQHPFTFNHLRLEGEGLLDPKEKSLELSLPKLQLGEVYFRVALDVARYDGLPEVKLRVDMPEQSCAALLRSVPERFAPHLQGARLTGSVWFKLEFNVDLMDIRKSIKLEIDGDLDRCDAITLGREFDVEALNRDDYVHRVVVKGEDLGIDVGPGTIGYMPLRYIPKVVQAAAYGTEDLAFFKHNGFRVGLMRRAIILFLERGYYAYGGSTISQQLVKNLFLTRTKTLSRKFQEAVIVWKMEKELTKERIFELYLNCIEYGPKIWGITDAAKTYFGKQPSQLHGMEAAFIMGLKPDPGYGYLQYRRGKLNKHWRKNLERVVKRLYDMGAISYEKYNLYMSTRLRFKLPGGAPPADPDEDRPVNPGQEEFEEI
jgi:hypothetical protein